MHEGQGKSGQDQTSPEDRYFFVGHFKSANEEGHDGTGLRGCCSIQALSILLLSDYMKWEEILFHWFKLTQSELKKELSMFTFHLAFVSKSKSLSLYLLKWRPDLFIPRLKTNTFVLHLLMFCPEKTYLESPGNAQKCSREHLKSQNFRGPWAGPEPHAVASQIVGKTQTKTPTYFILFHWFKLIQSELKNEVKLC